MNKNIILFSRVIVLFAFLGIWESVATYNDMMNFAISKPTIIFLEVWVLIKDFEFFSHFFATGGAAFLGLIIGTFCGTVLGLCTWFSRMSADVLKPFLLAAGAMPLLSIAPLMIIWFGVGFKMKVAISCLSTIFIAFSQAAKGTEMVENKFLFVLKGMNASKKQIFFMAVIPGSLDWVFSAMRLNAGSALLGAFIGEFISSNVGLGYLILKAASLYNVPRALAAAMFIVILALIFDFLASKIERNRNVIIGLFSFQKFFKLL